MECMSCGGNIEGGTAGNVVTCQFCGTQTAVVVAIGISEASNGDANSTLRKLLRVSQIDIEGKRYDSAEKQLKDAVAIDPECWEAYANLAICCFWLDTDQFPRLTEVAGYLAKAAALTSNSAAIAATTRAISFNIALLANLQNDKFGDNANNTIRALVIAKGMVDVYPERDKLINDYIQSQGSLLVDRLKKLLARDKRDFDPPLSELKILYSLIMLSKDPPDLVANAFIAFGSHKLTRKPDGALSAMLEDARRLYKTSKASDLVPKLAFPVFGGPKIIAE